MLVALCIGYIDVVYPRFNGNEFREGFAVGKKRDFTTRNLDMFRKGFEWTTCPLQLGHETDGFQIEFIGMSVLTH